jgi:hypothetical protein
MPPISGGRRRCSYWRGSFEFKRRCLTRGPYRVIIAKGACGPLSAEKGAGNLRASRKALERVGWTRKALAKWRFENACDGQPPPAEGWPVRRYTIYLPRAEPYLDLSLILPAKPPRLPYAARGPKSAQGQGTPAIALQNQRNGGRRDTLRHRSGRRCRKPCSPSSITTLHSNRSRHSMHILQFHAGLVSSCYR